MVQHKNGYVKQVALLLLLSAAGGFPLDTHAAITTKKNSLSAEPINPNKPAFISADAMYYDEEHAIVTAAGHVEILQDGRMLLADYVTYNQANDTVNAKGNISIMEPTGDVYFADELELTDNFKEGIVNSFRVRFQDNSLMAAKTAKRSGQNVTILEKAVYSPCSLCKDGKKQKPQWQIRADKVTINQDTQKVKYKNAFFDVYGVPVFYTPYFTHATPGADAKSGFLTPTYGSVSNLGAVLKIPYYITLGPDKDITLTPYLTSKQGPVMIGDFRHLTERGMYRLTGSITDPEDYRVAEDGSRIPGRKLRGHVQGRGDFIIDPLWTAGFSAKYASDDTYLRRYKFGDEDYLTSVAYAERMHDRDYTVIKAIGFQELTNFPNTPRTPMILPLIDSHVEKEIRSDGEKLWLDSNALVLYRQEGTQNRRISLTGGWQKPYTTETGHIFQLNGSLRGDLYSVSKVVTQEQETTLAGFTSRAIPEARVDWRFPLVKESQNNQIFIEPMANMIISPYGSNPAKIPNEDSQVVELSDDNLFSSHRFSGLDRVEEGPRANYGVRSAIYTTSGQGAQLLIGQSYHVQADSNLTQGSGIHDGFSDYVGRLSVFPVREVDVSYRFRLDRDTFVARHNEISSTLHLSPFMLHVSYLALNELLPTVTPNREEVFSSASFALSKEWTVGAEGRRSLAEQGGMITAGSHISYHGDCLDAVGMMIREYVRDRDITPSTSFTLQIFLKNLR